MVDDTHDLMSFSWPPACLSSRWHSAWQPCEFVISFSLFTLTLKFALLVKYAFCRHSLSENPSSVDRWHHASVPFSLFLWNHWLQTFYQKLDGFTFLLPPHWTLREDGKENLYRVFFFFLSTRSCETSEPAVCLTKVHYLSSKMDGLEVLNTIRSDILCISALFPTEKLCYHLPSQMVCGPIRLTSWIRQTTNQHKIKRRNKRSVIPVSGNAFCLVKSFGQLLW